MPLLPKSPLWRVATFAALSFGIGGSLILAQAKTSATDPAIEFNQDAKRALARIELSPGRAEQELGIAMLRAGRFAEAERWMRRAILRGQDGPLLRGSDIPALSPASFKALETAILRRDPAALFAAGAFAQWRESGTFGEETLTLYELVIGGDEAVQIALERPFRRALMRADARARDRSFDSARAELGLALAAEPKRPESLGRYAAYLLGAQDFALAEATLVWVITHLPAGEPLHRVLPAADSPWWRRVLLDTDACDEADAPLAQIIVSALVGKIDRASALVTALPSRPKLAPELVQLPFARLNDLNAFVASCVSLPPRFAEQEPVNAAQTWERDFEAERFDRAAESLAELYQKTQEKALLGPYAMAALANAANSARPEALAGVAGALRQWALAWPDVPPSALREYLSAERRAAIIDWLGQALEQTREQVLLRFVLGDALIESAVLLELAETEPLVDRWLPEEIRKDQVGSLPDPSKAPNFLASGDRHFRSGRIAEAQKDYLEAARHDPTLADLNLALLRAAIALGSEDGAQPEQFAKDFDRAQSLLISELNARALASKEAARGLSLMFKDFASKAQLSRWRQQAFAYAELKPLEWNRVLLVALIDWESGNWSTAHEQLKTYWEIAPADRRVAGVEFLLEVARENVER